MAELLIIHKKNIYYNDYNFTTKVITNSSVMPFNQFYTDNEYIRNTTPFKTSDAIVI